MMFDISYLADGTPFLKKVDRRRNRDVDGRTLWVEVGKAHEKGISNVIEQNKAQGYLVLMDEDGVYRALINTD